MSDRTLPRFDEHIRRAVNWFYENYIEGADCFGWSHYAGNPRVTEWGGTLDAVRALLYAGESIHHPKIAKSIEWLKRVQRDDGGWLSWEMRQSSVEVTAWVLITLKSASTTPTDLSISRGVDFLLAAQHDDGGWGAYKGAVSRIYPTLLSVLALDGLSPSAAARGVIWLQAAVNSDGGWGFKYKDELSNVAMTSMALYSLLTVTKIQDQSLKRRAVDWIKENQRPNGLWEPVFEDWINYEDPTTRQELPTRTDHFSSAWAIMSLIKASEPVLGKHLFDAIHALAEMQEQKGAWAFVPYDPNRHTWCVANCLWALIDAKNVMYAPTTYYQSIIDQTSQFNTVKKFVLWIAILLSINSLSVISLIVYVSGLHTTLITSVQSATGWATTKIINNLASFIVTTIGTVLASYIFYKFTTRRTRK
jgi:prenyltransferase beta subunit